MNPVIKKLWVDALRSGEYKQSQSCLKSTVGYCCLGVLCELHSKETGNRWEDKDGRASIYLGRKLYLPSEVMEWANIQSPDPVIDSEDGLSLSEINDDFGDFPTIADIIEENL